MLGCANQAGEDNRNVARMAALLAGLPVEVPGTTVNRLCGSGLDAVAIAARAVRAGEADLVIAGGVESMTRAPHVMPKAGAAWSRTAEVFDTTIGWRFVNPAMRERYGTHAMPETAEIVAERHGISRADQDLFALSSQERAAKATANGRLAKEIEPVPVPQRKGEPRGRRGRRAPPGHLDRRPGEAPPDLPEGTVTAGNSSGINDGAAAVLVASDDAVRRYGLEPLARVSTGAVAGVAPEVMGIGRCPPRRRCSRGPGSASATWTSSS